MKVFVFYPPGELYQRGEDRCMINVEASTANAMRACNDLGYMASVLRKYGDEIFLRDYATEGLSYNDYILDVKKFIPDVIVLSTTNTTIYSDIDIINRTIEDADYKGKVILKGAIFFDAPEKLFELLDLKKVDYLIGGEAEWIIGELLHTKKSICEIPCVYYKEGSEWKKTFFTEYNENLDDIPFPARDLMKNELYIRPDTGEPMATIQTGHGCPSNCIYCLTPKISGKKLRLRSPQNVMDELEECYEKYGIKNFFFRADTFTYNKKWVLELCGLIKKSNLNGKIAYTANSRVKPLSYDVLKAMKDTGCFTIAFGMETGSPDTMQRIRKGVTVDENIQAVKMAKKVGLQVLGFFMMGFPWETKEHLEATKRLMFKTDCDFIEIHVALPYYGTELYDQCKDGGVLGKSMYGSDIFHASTTGTQYMLIDDLMDFRKKTLLEYYLRPKYIIRMLMQCKDNPKVFFNYAKYGLRMVKNLVWKER